MDNRRATPRAVNNTVQKQLNYVDKAKQTFNYKGSHVPQDKSCQEETVQCKLHLVMKL